jgi:hypothetical protein
LVTIGSNTAVMDVIVLAYRPVAMQRRVEHASETVKLLLETVFSSARSVSNSNYCCRGVYTDALLRNGLHNRLLLLRTIPSNDGCLHSRHVATGLYATLCIYNVYKACDSLGLVQQIVSQLM